MYWLNATAARWPGAPSWAVANDHLSGAALAAATISATVFSGRLLAMMWTIGVSPQTAIGVKSVTGS